MGFLIATRNPHTEKLEIIIGGEIVGNDASDEAVAEFDSEDAAHAAAHKLTVCQSWGYEVLKVSL